MMEVDISNIWGELSLPDLLGLEKAVFYAHRAVAAAPAEYGLTAAQLEDDFELYSYENPAWLYAAARTLLFRLGRTNERVEFHGPETRELSRYCELLPADPAGERCFVTLICAGLPEADIGALAEQLSEDGTPVIVLYPDTPEQLRAFLRFSAALWEKLN